MKVLITGNAGFIGSFTAEHLLERGDAIVGIDNLNDYYDVNLKKDRLQRLEKYEFRQVIADIAEPGVLDKLISEEKPDKIVHLAAQAGVRYSLENPHAYIHSNITGFLNVLEACRNHGTKHLVYASTSSVYGANTEMPYSVKHNVDHPLSLYAASKKSNELMAHTYSHLFGIPCLFWSRFIVILAYVVMLLLYYVLAKNEELRCVKKFGDDYKHYLSQTSPFIPGMAMDYSKKQLCIAFPLVLLSVLGGAWGLKGQVIDELQVLGRNTDTPTIVLASMDEAKARAALELAQAELEGDKAQIRYLAPASWAIPEIGLSPAGGYAIGTDAELAHPTMHGNVADYTGEAFSLLVTRPVYRTQEQVGLQNLIAVEPLYRLNIDLQKRSVTRTDNLQPGRWNGIPVPVY